MRGTKNITQAANDIKVTVAQQRDISLSGTEQTLQITDGRIARAQYDPQGNQTCTSAKSFGRGKRKKRKKRTREEDDHKESEVFFPICMNETTWSRLHNHS